MTKRGVTAGCTLLWLLLGGGLLGCKRARACYQPEAPLVPGPCIPYFQNGSDLWEHVEENVGRDVVVDSATLVLGPRGLRCTAKYCQQHDQSKTLGEAACVPCNQCHLQLTLQGTGFYRLVDPDGQEVECAGDDCGSHITCSPAFFGWHRVFAHIEKCGEGSHGKALYGLRGFRYQRQSP